MSERDVKPGNMPPTRPEPPICPNCGGQIWVLTGRAWCMRRYASGGCGGYWPRWPIEEDSK